MRSLHHRDHRHLGWDASLDPALTVEPDDEFELALIDCFGGQLSTEASAADVASLDPDLTNPLTGPIEVEGALPGDALAVQLLGLEVAPVGWTTLIPGFGLLADEFLQPHVVVSRIDADHVRFGSIARLPTRPMLGTVGCAPATPGRHSVIPPRNVGGNLDCRDVRAGATLLLPVEVPGALLSAGDAHATQGDGEVCGTGIETAAVARLRVGLLRGRGITAPQLELPPERPRARGARIVTTGIGPDLLTGARDATRAMIERLVRDRRMAAEDAYALCSVAADLRIVEAVDAPNWVVALDLDLGHLEE